MARQTHTKPAHKLNRVDALLLDVIAQVEAIFGVVVRCKRPCCGSAGEQAPVSPTERRRVISQIQKAAEQITHHHGDAAGIVGELSAAAGALE